MLLVVSIFAFISFPVVTWNQPWSLLTKLFLLLSALFAVTFAGLSMYSAPLLAHRDLKSYYGVQAISALSRLAVCSFLHAIGFLTAVLASFMGAIGLLIIGIGYKIKAKPFFEEAFRDDPVSNGEMIRYLKPMIPGLIYNSIQGQVMVVIITFVGKAANIAEVTALGRIGQLFVVLSAFNSVVIEPYIAGVSRRLLFRRYALFILCGVGVVAVIMLVAELYPGALLWVLGSKYSHLTQELFWAITASCIFYLAALMWTMHAARKWVWGWATFFYITANVAVIVVSSMILDLGTTAGVLKMGVLSGCVGLILQIVIGFVGFLPGGKAVAVAD